MKNQILLLLIFIYGASNCIAQNESQAFRFDTIPANQQSQQPLFKLEQSGNQQQQQQQQPVPRKALTKTKNSSSQGWMTFGGSFGMSFGNGYSSINISPQIGYQFNQYVALGGGISYFYYDEHHFSQNYLGLNGYAKFLPVRYLAFQVQPEIYQMWGSHGGHSLDSKTVPCILLGGGVNIPTGRRGAITTMIYYDVLQDRWSPYGDQILYSIGYSFGF